MMMSILIAGRIGSAMAAEIGSMRVYQEIDALRTMNINPIHYLVMPRLVAIAVALPLLVIICHPGRLGRRRWLCGLNVKIAVPFQAFFSDLRDTVDLQGRRQRRVQELRFALMMGVVSCHQG